MNTDVSLKYKCNRPVNVVLGVVVFFDFHGVGCSSSEDVITLQGVSVKLSLVMNIMVCSGDKESDSQK